MKLLKLFVIAATALALTGPAFAGRDQAQIMEQARAAQKMQQERAAQKLRAARGLAGPPGQQGMVGPGTQSSRLCRNFGHPSERVRC